MAVPTSAHEMGVDSRRAGEGLCVPKVPGAEQGQQTYSKMQRVRFISITVIQYPNKSNLWGEWAYFGSQFQRGTVSYGRVEMVTEA